MLLSGFTICCCGERSMLLWSIVVLESPGEEASSAANKESSFWTKDWVIDVSELVIRLDSIEFQGSWCCIP